MILRGSYFFGKTFTITGVMINDVYPAGHAREGERLFPTGQNCIVRVRAYDYEGGYGTAQITVIADI